MIQKRWWGIEIRFSPYLDEVFSVITTNNISITLKIDSSTSDSYHDMAEEYHSVKANIEINKVLLPIITELRTIVKSSQLKNVPQLNLAPQTRVNTRVKEDNTQTASQALQRENQRRKNNRTGASVDG